MTAPTPTRPALPLRLFSDSRITYRLPGGHLATLDGCWDGTTDGWGRLAIVERRGEWDEARRVYVYLREIVEVKELP